MKTAKFKIGDVVSFEGNRGLNVAKINSILFTKKGEIEYYFEGYDEYSKLEDDLTLYTENKADDKQEEVKEKKQELPKKWEEVKAYPSDKFLSRWSEICNLIDIAKEGATTEFFKHIAFMKLILLRDIYRQGWKPNWSDTEGKFDIEFFNDEIISNYITKSSAVLSFEQPNIRTLFLSNFRDLIEECKEFI